MVKFEWRSDLPEGFLVGPMQRSDMQALIIKLGMAISVNIIIF